ncbi:MAG: transposase, partial [Herbaspirillum sp.]|nr:transposase [Herbaspirillum sp.]
RLNDKKFPKLPGSRPSQFEALDRPVLKPLPSASFEYADWDKGRVGPDYHLEVEDHFYSVPYQLVGRELDVRFTASTVECLHRGQRVACHVRSYVPGQCTTVPEHQPPAHRHHAEWTAQKLLKWAHESGPATGEVVEAILISKPHPHQGLQSCVGLRSLSRGYGEDRLEAACQRALVIRGLSYKSIRSILRNGLDRQALPDNAPSVRAIEHGNVRGASYYQGASKGTSSC